MPTPLLSYTVDGGESLPLTREARCHTCRHPERRLAELRLIRGASYTEAVAGLTGDPPLTSRNLREHVRRKHLPLDHEVIRRLIAEIDDERADVVAAGVQERVLRLVVASFGLDLVFRPPDLRVKATRSQGRPQCAPASSGKMIARRTESLLAFDAKSLTRRAGLGHWHPHGLRHSAASLLSAAGVPLEQIADVLGHDGTRTTAIVDRHAVLPTVGAAVDPMERLFGR